MKSFAVNWTPPAGDWEHYRILLFNDSMVLLNTTVGKEETHYALDGLELIPGRQYEVDVIVESGNLRSSKRCQGRTGKTNANVTHSLLHRTTDVLFLYSLKVSYYKANRAANI